MNKKAKTLRKQYSEKIARAKLKRIQREIVDQIAEITFPGVPPEMLSQLTSESNELVKFGLEGKWIDGSEMTPDKEQYMEQIANEIFATHTTPEQKEQLRRRFTDLNEVNKKLYPGPKKILNLDI